MDHPPAPMDLEKVDLLVASLAQQLQDLLELQERLRNEAQEGEEDDGPPGLVDVEDEEEEEEGGWFWGVGLQGGEQRLLNPAPLTVQQQQQVVFAFYPRVWVLFIHAPRTPPCTPTKHAPYSP